jgi:EmrB/QacA subfamily drug resistance transporter
MGDRKGASPDAVLLTVCVAQFMVPLMLTAVGVALPSIGRELKASAGQLALVEQLYILSPAISMLTFGRLGDLAGRVRVFLIGLVLFTVLTASLGFVQNMWMLLVQRFLQGIGASMLLSGSMALVASAFPPEVRGRKIGIVSAFTYSGLSLGPVLGGFITSRLGWRFVFWLPVPFGIAASLLCFYRMRGEFQVARGEKMDWRGSLIFAFGVALVMLGASHLGAGISGVLMMFAGFVFVFLFGIWETHTPNPLLEISIFSKNKFFTLSCFAAMVSYAATFGLTFSMSLYLQYVMDLSAHSAGFILLIQPVSQMLLSPVAGKIADRISAVRVANVGIGAVSTGLLLIALAIGTGASLQLIAVILALIGAGFGIFITPNTVAIIGSVEPRQYGMASGMIGTVRTLGMVTSMTTITLVFSLLMGSQPVTKATIPAFISSMQVVLFSFAAFSVLGVTLSLRRGLPYRRPNRSSPT